MYAKKHHSLIDGIHLREPHIHAEDSPLSHDLPHGVVPVQVGGDDDGRVLVHAEAERGPQGLAGGGGVGQQADQAALATALARKKFKGCVSIFEGCVDVPIAQ